MKFEPNFNPGHRKFSIFPEEIKRIRDEEANKKGGNPDRAEAEYRKKIEEANARVEEKMSDQGTEELNRLLTAALSRKSPGQNRDNRVGM